MWRHSHLSKGIDACVPFRHVAYIEVYLVEGVLRSRLFERNFSLEQSNFSDATFSIYVDYEGIPCGRTPRTNKVAYQKQTLQVLRREQLTVAVYKVICCVQGMAVCGDVLHQAHNAYSF